MDARARRFDLNLRNERNLAAEYQTPPSRVYPIIRAYTASSEALVTEISPRPQTLDRPRGGGLASTLAAAGLHVYTSDLRGHGESTPGAAQGGEWNYDDVVNGDIPAIVAWAHARHLDVFASFERDLIRGRTRAALATKRAKGLNVDDCVSPWTAALAWSSR